MFIGKCHVGQWDSNCQNIGCWAPPPVSDLVSLGRVLEFCISNKSQVVITVKSGPWTNIKDIIWELAQKLKLSGPTHTT